MSDSEYPTPPEMKSVTMSMSEDILQIFDRLHKRFITYEKNGGQSRKAMDYLTKLAGAVGYMAQVHASLAKTYEYEERLTAIETKLDKIPLDILSKYLKPATDDDLV